MKKLIVIFLILSSLNICAQEPVFSQYYFNPILLNPALAGMDNNFRVFMNGRNQWSKVPSSFNINSVAFDTGKIILILLFHLCILLVKKVRVF